MITNFKIFESNIRLRKNDYVICEEQTYAYDENEKIVQEFIKSNVGQYIKFDRIADNKYGVKYENIPSDIENSFDNFTQEKSIRWMDRKEIIHYSKNKEDLEVIVNMKKYNL